MNLISRRPTQWNAIIGQERALRLITAILTTARFIPRGFIFCGSYGSGKTSTAYLMARALLCQGEDRLGCGSCAIQCPSCQIIDSTNIEDGLDKHPDYKKVVAAEHSGVEYARSVRDISTAIPVLNKCRVILIDEAHRLSPEAWDVYLTPLEKGDNDCVFIYVTSDFSKVPDTIKSRCNKIRFRKVSEEAIFGLLVATSAREKIPYDLNALREIARRSENAPRNALKYLGEIASMGNVSLDLIDSVVEIPLETKCRALYDSIISKNQAAAVEAAEDVAEIANPGQVVEKMFDIYTDAVFEPHDLSDTAIRERFGDIPAMTTFFLKWQAGSLPASALALFAYEMMYLKDKRPPAPVIVERKVEKPVEPSALVTRQELFS
jgi:DNA polymerase-3 subunit gamma/tau